MKLHLFVFFVFKYFFLTGAIKNQRIIGGGPAYTAQFPFIAAIYKITSDGQYFCGGTIVNQRWILTAGQCVDNATLFTIYLGTNDIKNVDSTGIKVATDEYVLHPDYNPLTLQNDVGLIKLRMNLTYTSYIKPATFEEMDLTPSSNYGTLSAVGWGQTTDESSELTDKLQFVRVEVLENDECRITYGSQLTDKMLCAVGNYNQGTCHGDTGTPLVLSYRITQTVNGIASFVSANGCESSDSSGYTRTYPYLSWIRNVTSSL